MTEASAQGGTTIDKRQQTISAVQRLPIEPGPLAEVLACNPTDADALIAALERSPALAARVIGVANSAGSRAIHRMETVTQCVRYMGPREARSVALAMALRQMSHGLTIDAGLLEKLRGSAVLKASASRLAAEAIVPGREDAAFTAGLLQDLALPMLAAHAPEAFAKLGEASSHGTAWVEKERELFGIDHAELAAHLLEAWGVSKPLVAAVRDHHRAFESDAADDQPAGLNLAGGIAALLPHLDEKPTKKQGAWLAAAHTRFLSGLVSTPAGLLSEARRRANDSGLCKTIAQPSPDLMLHLVEAVTNDTFGLAARVSHLDRQVCEHTGDFAELQRDAMTDALTGLLNRRGLDTIGQQALTRALEENIPVTCVMIDLDDFKPVNDTLGHEAGDRLLKATAELLKTGVGPRDIVARLGGDEFAMFLIGADQGQARAAVERLHASCNGRELPVSGGQKATLRMSIGGLHLPALTKALSAAKILDAADQLMYHCKRNGKAGIIYKALPAAA